MSDQGAVEEIRKIKVNQPSSGDSVKVETKKKVKEKGSKKTVLVILLITILASLIFRFWENLRNENRVNLKTVEFGSPEKQGGVNWEKF